MKKLTDSIGDLTALLMSPISRSDGTSPTQTLTWGMVGTVLTLMTLVVGTLQYRRMCHAKKSRPHDTELRTVQVEVYPVLSRHDDHI
jgi:hypothetical protein